MCSIVASFRMFSRILALCPCCGDIVPVAGLRLRYVGKVQTTFLDLLAAEDRTLCRQEQRLERQRATFAEQELFLRLAARKRGREKMRQRMLQIEPALRKLKQDPDDIKVVCHPVDLIVFQGLNGRAEVRNIILVNRRESRNILRFRKPVVQALERGRLVWETIKIASDGAVRVIQG